MVSRTSFFGDVRPCIPCPKCDYGCPTCHQPVYSDVLDIITKRQHGCAIGEYKCMNCGVRVDLATFNFARSASRYNSEVSSASRTVLVAGSNAFSASSLLLPSTDLLPQAPLQLLREPSRATAWAGNDCVRSAMFAFFCTNPRAYFSSFVRQDSLKGLTGIGKEAFLIFRHQFWIALCNQMRKQCDAAKADAMVAYSDGTLSGAAASADGTYGCTNWRSEHITVFVLSVFNGCMLAVGHMSQKAKVASGLTSPWAGTAKSAEAHLLCILIISLLLSNFTLKWFVKDSDAGATSLLQTMCPSVQLIDCFLHYLKNMYKRLINAFKQKEVEKSKTTGAASDRCKCVGSRHKAGCGCASEVHASHVYNLAFVCMILACKQPQRFITLLNVLKKHISGDHSSCAREGLHAATLCGKDHKPYCPRRECVCTPPEPVREAASASGEAARASAEASTASAVSPRQPCGTEKDGEKAKCYGKPKEATCASAKPYQSTKVPAINCSFHLARTVEQIDKLIEDAPSLMLSSLNLGVMHTNALELANSVVNKSRMKGVNQGAESYGVLTTIGLLNANQLPYARMLLRQGRPLRDCIWEFEVAAELNIALTEECQQKLIKSLQKRLAASDKAKTQEGRLEEIREQHKSAMKRHARGQHDGGLKGYAQADLTAIATVRIIKLQANVCIVYFDIETAGFGMHQDTLMELYMSAVRVTSQHDDARPLFVALEAASGRTSVAETAIDSDSDVNDSDEDADGKPVQAKGYDFKAMGTFHQRSRVFAFAKRNGVDVPGHSHLDLEQMMKEQTEAGLIVLLVAFLKEIREKLGPGVPIVLAAHNGRAFDGYILHKSLQRHGVSSTELFAELDIQGIVDTLAISRRLPWSDFKSETATRKIRTYPLPAIDSKLPYMYEDALRFVNVRGFKTSSSKTTKEEAVRAEREQCQRELDGGSPDATSATDHSESDSHSDEDSDASSDKDEAIGVLVASRPIEALPQQPEKKLQHTVLAIYQRLFNRTLNAHEALEDATAVEEIAQHPFFWANMVNNDVVDRWSHLTAHYDELHRQHEANVLGWTQEHCPVCEHGTKIPHLMASSAAASDALAEGAAVANWKVTLACRVNGSMPACATSTAGVRPGYTLTREPKMTGASTSGRARKAKAPVVIPEGGCACNSKCATSRCPCVAAGRTCNTAVCLGHAKAACKCANK
jgi:hypothetical protein